jgi:Polyketide cyclase / dehydrase and lipid transport
MEFVASHTLGASPEAAFDLLADLRNQARWSGAPIEAELLSAEPVGLGSRFRATHAGRDYEATITAYARPELLRIEVLGAHLTVQGDFVFTPAEAGALLDAVVDIGAKGPMRFVLPSFRGRIAAELPKEAAGFARFCEGWATA